MRVGRALAAAAALAFGGAVAAGCSAILGIGELVPPVGAASDGAVDGDNLDADIDVFVGPSTMDANDAEASDQVALPDQVTPPDQAACTYTPCTPPNICDKGTSCEGGDQSCADLGAADPTANGVSCGNDVVCASGSCLSDEWAEWPMPNYTQGMTAIPNTKSYTQNVDGTVTDNVTGLTWQRALSATMTDAGSTVTTYAWADAAQYCAGLSLGSRGGWRMPTMIEVLSLVDYSQATPAIDSSNFPGTPADYFWVSTLYPGSTSSAGVVSLDNGGEGILDVSTVHYVRCVR